MVNPGAFRGSRKDFLIAEKDNYSAGVQGNYANDVLADIQRRYFKRYPVDLPHNEEPSAEHIASVDDAEAEPEPEEPDAEKLDPGAYAEASKALEERRKLIVYRRAQIKRWLAYHYMKDHDLDPNESGARNPYRILLHQLTGTHVQRPRLKTASNVWRRTHRRQIESAVQRRATAQGINKKKLAPLREAIAKELYAGLPNDERQEWERLAKDEHAEALATYETDSKSRPSTKPEDRQRCIQGLTQFVSPILDLICEATRWKASLIAGGPEPAHGGRLNVVCVHSGTTSGDIKLTFGRAERARYLSHILPIYGDFLRKCYTPQECKDRALSVEEGFEKMLDMEQDQDYGTIVDSVPEASESSGTRVATAPPAADLSNQRSPSPPANPPATELPSSTDMRPTSPSGCIRSPSLPAADLGTPSLPGSMRSPTPFSSNLQSRQASLSPLRGTPPISVEDDSSIPALPSIPAGDDSALPVSAQLEPSPVPQLQTAVSSSRLPPTPIPSRQALLSPLRSTPPISVEDPSIPALPSIPAGDDSALPVSAQLEPSPVPPTVIPANLAEVATVEPRSPPEATSPAASSTLAPVPSRKRKAVDEHANSRKSKQSCTSRTRATPSVDTPNAAAAPPADTPEWFLTAFNLFNSEDLGNEWKELIKEWGRFERQEGYVEVGRVSPKGRPELVKMWIDRHRSASFKPSIQNLKEFEKQFNGWWMALQPEWRRSTTGKLRRTSIGVWDCLKLPGMNGLQSVLFALFHWGIAAKGSTVHRRAWGSALDDCLFVISNLCN